MRAARLSLALLLAPLPAGAVEYKLTPTYYRTTSQSPAWDINLRGNHEAHTAWIGFYRRGEEFQQLRLGYENAAEFPLIRVTPSMQYATRGFLGGNATAETGGETYALFGLGRTNRRDYYNLNFDPNDAVTIGVGTRALRGMALSAYQIRDDRLGTGQRVLHLVARMKPDADTRWTVDLFRKRGRASPDDPDPVHGTGISIAYDFERYFAKLASDPHVNFSRDHMVRVALGMRF